MREGARRGRGARGGAEEPGDRSRRDEGVGADAGAALGVGWGEVVTMWASLGRSWGHGRGARGRPVGRFEL